MKRVLHYTASVGSLREAREVKRGWEIQEGVIGAEIEKRPTIGGYHYYVHVISGPFSEEEIVVPPEGAYMTRASESYLRKIRKRR